MRASFLSRFVPFALLAPLAVAQIPTFTVVDTSALNATFGNTGKAVLDPQAVGFVGVTFGNDLFVAVVASTSENVVRWATSPDGTTWTARSQPTPSGYTTFQTSKVHFLNGKFIFFTGFGGGDGSVSGTTWCYFSTDGLTWTANKVANTRINVEEFDASPTLYVAAAHNGNQVSSTDLITWTPSPVVPNAAGFDHNDLAYFNGKFFSSTNGFSGTTYASTDAATWTAIPSTVTPGGGRLEAGNGYLISTVNGSQYRSTDGATFTKLTLSGTPSWFYPGGSPRYTSAGFVATGISLTTFKTGYMVSADGQSWTALGTPPDAPKAETGFLSRYYTYSDIAYGAGKYVIVGQETQQAAFAIQNLPLIIALEAAPAPSAGGTTLTATNLAAGATVQWQRNGVSVSGATSASYALSNVQPADTGIYTAVVTTNGATSTQSFAVGVATTSKTVGSAAEVGSNIVAPNRNVYDQLLLQGVAAAFTADSALNQITRLSFVDLSNDIVQVEFSGPGTVSLVLDGSTGPAAPANYNQPGVSYMKGHAGIVVTGATENTHLSVFSVGKANAVNQTLFKDGVMYDGMADLAFIAIASANGKFGGLRTSNASYFATKGLTGIYAPNVQFTGPVFVGDINASDAATPVLVIGSSSDTRITGGDLLQANGRAVQVAGLTQLKFTANVNSHGVAQAAQTNRGKLEQNGVDVTAQIVVNP